jgi:hypothetical protein
VRAIEFIAPLESARAMSAGREPQELHRRRCLRRRGRRNSDDLPRATAGEPCGMVVVTRPAECHPWRGHSLANDLAESCAAIAQTTLIATRNAMVVDHGGAKFVTVARNRK